MPAPPLEVAAGDGQRGLIDVRAGMAVMSAPGGGDLAEHEQELKGRNRFARLHSNPAAFRARMTVSGFDAFLCCRSRAAAAGQEVDDADAALRLERLGDVPQQASELLPDCDGSSISRYALTMSTASSPLGSRGSVGVPSTVRTLVKPSCCTRRLITSIICGWMSCA